MEITSGKIEGPQKIVIYGPEGIGKSTLASKFPRPVFIDTEGSTKHLDVARTPRPSSWTMLMEQVAYVWAKPDLCDTLVIDTADWAEQLCITEICAKAQKNGIEDFGYGKGYVYLAEEFGRLLNMLEQLIEKGINVVVVAHAQMRKFEQPDEAGAYDRWELKLQKKTAPLLKEWADMVLFANYKTYVVNVDGQGTEKGKNKAQGGSRVMYTSHHPCWDAKNRHDLPPEIRLDFAEIAAHIVTGTKVAAPVTTNEPEPTAAPELSGEDPAVPTAATEPTEPTPTQPPETKETQAAAKEAPEPDARQVPTEPISDASNNGNEVDPGIPKPLADLMKENKVTIAEIQEAVAERGYYPKDTPIANYDPQFISGVLVGAWGQVFELIRQLRGVRFLREDGKNNLREAV